MILRLVVRQSIVRRMRAQCMSLLFVFFRFIVQSSSNGKKLSGRDSGLEKVFEISSLEMNCRAERSKQGHGPVVAASLAGEA